MAKIKHLILFVCMAGCLAACKKDKDNFDVEKQFEADTAIIGKFVRDNKINAIKHESGIFYQVISAGSGNVDYSKAPKITAEYKGSFLDGNVFDQSKDAPLSFYLSNVILGWQIGIPLIQPGGEIRLIVPSGYAYGHAGRGSIPPDAILDFNVKVKSAN